MSPQQMVRQLNWLSSGTLAGLFGVRAYNDIESNLLQWLDWVHAQTEDKRWGSWVDCWHEYRRVS